MKNTIFLFFTLFINSILCTAYANIRLPAIIGSHMVLQQNADVKLWGWADPGEKISVSVSWDTAQINTTAANTAKWILSIKTPAAGGPFTITIKGYNTVVLEDVMVGETWACSGQSNMEMHYNWGIKAYTADADSANNTRIRFFHIPKLTAATPQDDTKGSWVVCNPADMKNFSLAGYFFGLRLQQQLNVPIGLINASWGGTPAEVWTPTDSVKNNPVLKEAADKLKPSGGWPMAPGYSFNAMISPITNFNIAGVIWYQGESNVGTAPTYQLLFSLMINAWRKAWQKELPFYFVQIAPFSGYDTLAGALLREAQTKTLVLPKTGMVVISDLVDDVKNIHPKNKKDVGIRLANLALASTYGKNIPGFKSPLYKSMGIEKDKVKIEFDYAENGLMAKGKTLTNFLIAGADKVFVPANAIIKGNSVIVSSKTVKQPVAVRFGFTSAAMPNLFNKEGLPVNTFRTDDWNDVK